jgi:FSR family fosmidomycin resistance protein-like MFS transporter
MSLFAAGGSVGLFLAPALATPALDAVGLEALVLFIPPAVLMAFVLSGHQAFVTLAFMPLVAIALSAGLRPPAAP